MRFVKALKLGDLIQIHKNYWNIVVLLKQIFSLLQHATLSMKEFY